jgi:hypothetical protein
MSGVQVCKPEQLVGIDSLIIPRCESITKAAAAQSDDGGLGSRPDGSRSRIGSFFLKIYFWCQLT